MILRRRDSFLGTGKKSEQKVERIFEKMNENADLRFVNKVILAEVML
jgi:hypothetical protein